MPAKTGDQGTKRRHELDLMRFGSWIRRAAEFAVFSDPERAGQNAGRHLPERMGLAGLDILEGDLGRAEQVRVDGVEIMVVPGEDRRKRLAVVARGRRRHLRADGFEARIVAGDDQDHPCAVQDRVIGPPDGREIVRGNRRQGGGADGPRRSA